MCVSACTAWPTLMFTSHSLLLASLAAIAHLIPRRLCRDRVLAFACFPQHHLRPTPISHCTALLSPSLCCLWLHRPLTCRLLVEYNAQPFVAALPDVVGITPSARLSGCRVDRPTRLYVIYATHMSVHHSITASEEQSRMQ